MFSYVWVMCCTGYMRWCGAPGTRGNVVHQVHWGTLGTWGSSVHTGGTSGQVEEWPLANKIDLRVWWITGNAPDTLDPILSLYLFVSVFLTKKSVNITIRTEQDNYKKLITPRLSYITAPLWVITFI